MPSSYAVGKHYEAFIKRLVKSGRYASASEVVRAALRELEARTEPPLLTAEDIRAAIKEAEDDPRPDIDGDVFLDELRQRHRAPESMELKTTLAHAAE
ncbi:MAG: type II toxin-antitoxin system ParD family antitoxin [Phyllobacteriaceae bacterium]|nr:type II toxin-antitoxin system ParD family antitoxin [Phyllobacteriaceae bacterium]